MEMIVTNIWLWGGFIAFVLVMLSLDLGVFNRTPHVVQAREALTWTAVWVGLALAYRRASVSRIRRIPAMPN